MRRVLPGHRLVLVLALLFVGVVNGCSEDPPQSNPVGVRSQFLADCNASCILGLECICGVCTRSCTSDGTCTEITPKGACVATSTAHPGCAGAPRVCDVTCGADEDCAGLPSATSCSAGFCRSSGAATDGGHESAGDAGHVDASDAGHTSVGPQPFQSCEGLAPCGPSGESCCASPVVTGGDFYRQYYGVNSYGGSYLDQGTQFPAAVTDFSLDKYEITVGRFRKFVAAWAGGWRPGAGSGKHTHLNGGQGLVNVDGSSPYERGWDPAWASNLAPTDANLASFAEPWPGCDPSGATWTSSPAGNENLPMSCINWYEAYAFCIWDGGFLPTATEQDYAISGGGEQRVFPWSNPAASTTIDCTYANYADCGTPGNYSVAHVGSKSPIGDGRYGQADLAGNLDELTLDSYSRALSNPCADCVQMSTATTLPTDVHVDENALRRVSGGAFDYDKSLLLQRGAYAPWGRGFEMGARCARAPIRTSIDAGTADGGRDAAVPSADAAAGDASSVVDAGGTHVDAGATVDGDAPDSSGGLVAVSFERLGFLSGTTFSGIAATNWDGSVAGGVSGADAARWTVAGFQSIAITGSTYGVVNGVSDDGGVLAGYVTLSGVEQPFRWTSATGSTVLPPLATESGDRVLALSGDGNVAAGADANQSTALRWIGTGAAAAVPGMTVVRAASYDGSVLVGASPTGASRWTAGSGAQDIGVSGTASGVSSDGSIVVGTINSGISGQLLHGFRWTAATGAVTLVERGIADVDVSGVSADGSVIIGAGDRNSRAEPAIWTSRTGFESVIVVLERGGIDLTGWTNFGTPCISKDGKVVFGKATNPQGQTEAFRIVLE